MQVNHVHADDRPGFGADFQIAQRADGRVGRPGQLMEFRIRIAAGAVDLDFLLRQRAERHAHRASHPADETVPEVVHRIARIIVAQGSVPAGRQEPLAIDVQGVVQLAAVRVGHPGDINHHVLIHHHFPPVDDVPVGVGVPLDAGEARHVGRGLSPVDFDRDLRVIVGLRKAQGSGIDGGLIKLLHAQHVVGERVFVIAVVHRRTVAGGAHVREEWHMVVVDNEPRFVVVVVLAPVRRVLEHHGAAVFRAADDGDAVVRIVVVAGLPDRLREAQAWIAVEKRRQAGARFPVVDDGEHSGASLIAGTGVSKLIQVRVSDRVLERNTVVKGGFRVIGHEQV